jgi:hypothetical protein
MMENTTAEFTGLTGAELRRIVEDLTSKYPQGPRRRLTKDHYEKVDVWSDAYGKYVSDVRIKPQCVGKMATGITEANLLSWGYDRVHLFALGISDEASAKLLISRLDTTCPRSGPGLTRSARRLWSRVKPAWNAVRRDGAAGIWNVSMGQAPYGSIWYRGISVWARDRAEAEAQALLVGPSTGMDVSWVSSLHISFTRLGTPDQATDISVKLASAEVTRIRELIKQKERDIATLRAKLEEEERKMGMVMGGIMLLSPVDDDGGSEAEVAQ